MVNAAIVRSGVSSDEGKKSRRATKDTATSLNQMRNAAMQQKIRKADPLHKYRVAVSSDGPAKRHSATGNRKEVLYPKSKQPIPDRSRLEDENEVTLSTVKKMQSRRLLRAAVKEMRHQEDLWSAKDITNGKSQQPQADVRVATDITNSQCHQNQADVRAAAQDITEKKHHQFQANVGVAKDITDVKSHESQTNMRAAKDTAESNSNQSHAHLTAANEKINKSKSQQPQVDLWAAEEISKTNQPQADNWPAEGVTSCRSQPRVPPGPETLKVVVPVIQELAPYTLGRARSSKSPTKTLVAKPQLSNTSSKPLKPSFTIKQGSTGLHHTRLEPRVTTYSTAILTADASTSTIKRTRQPSLRADTSVLSSRGKELVDVNLESAPGSPFSSATTSEFEMCNPCPSPLPVEILVLSPRPDGPVYVKQVSATLAASQEIKKSNPSPDELFEGFNIFSSSIPETRTCSVSTSPQVKTPVQDSHRLFRSNSSIGSLRHQFVMEATEIKGPNKPWHFMHRSGSHKAVLFSNPAFAPASPDGARPASEKLQRPVAATPPQSPSRSISATRSVMDRIGRSISAGRRSMSPDITRRLNCTRQKFAYISPVKSLPSLISRLPSRGKRKPSPVPRARVLKSSSCTRPSPQSKELSLRPGPKYHQREVVAAQANERTTFHASRSPAAASTDSSSCFSLRMFEEPTSIAQQFPFDHCFQGLQGLQGLHGNEARHCSKGKQISNADQLKWHTSLDWEKEMGIIGVLSSCRKWVEESAPPLPGGYCGYEMGKVVATDWEDELVAPHILSTSRRRKVEDRDVDSGDGSCINPEELNSNFSGVRSSFNKGRIRTDGRGSN